MLVIAIKTVDIYVVFGNPPVDSRKMSGWYLIKNYFCTRNIIPSR